MFEWINGPEEQAPPENYGEAVSDDHLAIDYSGDSLRGDGATFVPASAQAVWNTLLDPDAMASLIPGCRELTQHADDHFTGKVKMGVGAVRGTFDADIRLRNMTPARKVEIAGTLDGALGSSRGTGWVELDETEDGVNVRYRYSIHLSGTVASVGGRLLSGAAKMLINQFFRALVHRAAPDAQPRTGLIGRIRSRFGRKQ